MLLTPIFAFVIKKKNLKLLIVVKTGPKKLDQNKVVSLEYNSYKKL